jgi:hypothetical protein
MAYVSVSVHNIPVHPPSTEQAHHMTPAGKPYVHLTVDSVDLVVFDPHEQYDAERYDRYETFTQARDAALTCIETMLDEGDYDDEAHRSEIEAMQRLLESAAVFEDLEALPGYRWFRGRLESVVSAAA